MILDLEKLTSDVQLVTADEVITFEDVDSNQNRIRCHVELTVRKIAETLFLHADLKGTFTTPCHSCLEPARCEVESSFDLVVRRTGSTPGEGAATGDEELICLPPEENEISLDQHIYENLIVDIPIRIVCKEGCKGLCSRCGVNLNLKECGCAEEVEPRWEALRKLKDDISE